MFEGEPDWKAVCVKQYPQEKSSLVFTLFCLYVFLDGL